MPQPDTEPEGEDEEAINAFLQARSPIFYDD